MHQGPCVPTVASPLAPALHSQCPVSSPHCNLRGKNLPISLQRGVRERAGPGPGRVGPPLPCGGHVSLFTRPEWKPSVRHAQRGPALNSLSLTCQNLVGPTLLLWLDFPHTHPQVLFFASKGLSVTPKFPFGGPAVAVWAGCGKEQRVGSRARFPPWRCDQLGGRPTGRSPVPTTEGG